MKPITEDFSVGETVNVHKKDNFDMFNDDFTGTIREIRDNTIMVVDQDDECAVCDPDQLSFNTDAIMHS